MSPEYKKVNVPKQYEDAFEEYLQAISATFDGKRPLPEEIPPISLNDSLIEKWTEQRSKALHYIDRFINAKERKDLEVIFDGLKHLIRSAFKYTDPRTRRPDKDIDWKMVRQTVGKILTSNLPDLPPEDVRISHFRGLYRAKRKIPYQMLPRNIESVVLLYNLDGVRRNLKEVAPQLGITANTIRSSAGIVENDLYRDMMVKCLVLTGK